MVFRHWMFSYGKLHWSLDWLLSLDSTGSGKTWPRSTMATPPSRLSCMPASIELSGHWHYAGLSSPVSKVMEVSRSIFSCQSWININDMIRSCQCFPILEGIPATLQIDLHGLPDPPGCHLHILLDNDNSNSFQQLSNGKQRSMEICPKV